MKALIFSAMMIFGLIPSAHALIEEPGTFVPSQCGKRSAEEVGDFTVDLLQVCVGKIIGAPGPTVSFLFTDGSMKSYQVKSVSNFLVAMASGNKKAMLHLVSQNGEQVSMKVIRGNDGSMKSAAGQIAHINYVIPAFENVFAAQAVSY